MTLHTLRPRILVALVVAAVLLGLGAAAASFPSAWAPASVHTDTVL